MAVALAPILFLFVLIEELLDPMADVFEAMLVLAEEISELVLANPDVLLLIALVFAAIEDVFVFIFAASTVMLAAFSVALSLAD